MIMVCVDWTRDLACDSYRVVKGGVGLDRVVVQEGQDCYSSSSSSFVEAVQNLLFQRAEILLVSDVDRTLS